MTMPHDDASAAPVEADAAIVSTVAGAQVSREAALARLTEMFGEVFDESLFWAEKKLRVGRGASS
jgi:hypothetical protein